MENSKIEWTDYTFNPWIGCSKVSAGCANCYAEGIARRFKLADWGKSAERILSSDKYFSLPLQWDRKAAKNNTRYKVFCASMADVFDEKVPEDWRDRLFETIQATPNLDWLLLTKRPENALAYYKLFDDDLDGYNRTVWLQGTSEYIWGPMDLTNVWLGVSVENQKAADERIPILLQIPAAKRFLSMEPLLEAVNLTDLPVPSNIDTRGFRFNCLQKSDDRYYNEHPVIDWVIAGGESGRNARPVHPDWIRSIRDQCTEAGTPFLFKQWGEYVPTEGEYPNRIPHIHFFNNQMKRDPSPYPFYSAFKMGKKKSGRVLDGREWNEFPDTVTKENANV